MSRENEVFKTLTRIASRLGESKIPYVLVGGLALNFHGFERFTKDLADVQQLIQVLQLPESFGLQIDPSVRQEFLRLWHDLQGPE